MTTNPTSELKPILVFDSGIGGLTVLREARLLMPERGFIYVADDAGFPYGRWDEEPLRARIVRLFEALFERYDPEAVIIACNTAFTLAGADLRQRFPDRRFIGTVPAIKPAAERTRSGLVSVLATPGTVKRAYTRDLIQSFASQCHVRLVGSENLARMAEAYIRGETLDDAAVLAEIAPALSKRMACAPTSWFSPARIIRFSPTSSAGLLPGRWTGSIRRRRSRDRPGDLCRWSMARSIRMISTLPSLPRAARISRRDV